MILHAEFDLGDDYDCETCGMSYNSLEYKYDTDTGEHRVDTRVGCYGGESEHGDRYAIRAFLCRLKGEWPECTDDFNALMNTVLSIS